MGGSTEYTYIFGIYHTVLEIWATALSGGLFRPSRTCFLKKAILPRLNTLLWNVSKSLENLRKFPRSAGRKFRFSLQLCSKMHGFKYEFSKFFWGGAHRAPSPDPSPRSISVFAVDSRALSSSVWAAPSIHRSNMFDNPSPNRGVLDQTLFSPNPNFLATPDPIFRSKIT